MSEFWNSIVAFVAANDVVFRILLVLIACLVANWLLRIALARTVSALIAGVKKSQRVDATEEIVTSPYVNERTIQRTRTLGTFGRNIINWTTAVVAFFLVLAQFGVNLTAVITSAGFIAAGLAFGAQNVVKDTLNGLFMVFEDQMGVGDWVTVGSISGTVENVGIRVTQVRAIDGTLWFIRNGEILELGNTSQGWGRALIDITVDASADLDEVEKVTLSAANQAISQPEIRRKVNGKPEVWGVESAFGDRVTLRLAVRTRPEAQWAVQRALRPELIREFKKADIALATELPGFTNGKK